MITTVSLETPSPAVVALRPSTAAGSRLSASFRELVALASLAALTTVFAVVSVPLYDDGSVWQMVVDYEGVIAPNYDDRPLSGQIWQAMADTGYFWTAVTVLHFVAWFAIAIETTLIFRAAFPEMSEYAAAAGSLALCPMVVQVQQVLMTTVMHGLLGPAIVYGGAVLIMRLASSGGFDSPGKSIVGLSAAYAAAFLGNLVSEYGLAASFSCVVLLATFKSVHRSFASLRVWHVVGFMMAAGCGYLVYRQLGVVPTHKTEIALLGGNTSVVWHLLSVAGHFPTAVWEASVGRLLQEIGSLSLVSTLFVKSFVLGLIAAVTMSVVLRRRTATAAADRSRSRMYVGIGMLVALGVALGPVVLLGRTFVDNFQTRTLLPVLPVASCLGVSVLLFVLRERLTVIVAPLCFFLATYSNSVQGFHALDEERHVERWGQQLEPLVAEDGLTVAVFEIPRRRQVPLGNGWIGSFSNNEFTARMAKGWPGTTRKRFWAFRDWNTAVANGYLQGVDHAGTASNPRINRESRGSVRSGPVRRLLWITVDPGNLKLTITKTDFPVASSHSLR